MFFSKIKNALLINGFLMLACGCGHEVSSKGEISEITKAHPKLGPLLKTKFEIQDALKRVLPGHVFAGLGDGLKLDISDIEQIKIFLKIGSGAQSIVKEYVIRKTDPVGLDWTSFNSQFFVKPIDGEIAMQIKDEPTDWRIIMKETSGKFNYTAKADFGAGYVKDLNPQTLDVYVKEMLENWPIKDTKQLDDQGDFIVY